MGVDGDVPRAAIAKLAGTCAVIVTVLTAERTLRAVVAACGRVGRPGLVLLDLSSVAPSTQHDLTAVARASGVVLLGGRVLLRMPATGPRTTLYVDDEAMQAEALRDVLAMLAEEVVTTGSAGRAKALGLIDDLLANVNAAVVGEALALGRSVGLDAAALIALLRKGSGATAILAHRETAAVSTRERCAALARVAGAAQQADHSLLFGGVAIGMLLARPHPAGR